MRSPYAPTSQKDQDRGANCIRAELTGSDTARAAGIDAEGKSPVLKLCRRLIAAGIDPATPLVAYRGDTLALTIRCIGEAGDLEINAEGTGFRPMRQPDAACLAAPIARRAAS